MEQSRSTVVIITHNRKSELLRTVAHMTALPERPPVVVVDNASADGSAEAIRSEFPQVDVLVENTNRGAIGRNDAVARVRTPYVTFCDDDVRWQPGSVRRATEALDRTPELGAVMGRCLVEPELTEDPLTPELRNSPVPTPPALPGPALLSVMAGLTTFRVAAFREVGGFAEELWLGGEEELLAVDLVDAGWWLCWLEDIVVHHRPSHARQAHRRRQLGIRNTVLTAWLRRPVSSALRHTARTLASAPKDRATAEAVLEVCRRASWVRRERSVVAPDVERMLRLLEGPQRRSVARRYVG